MIRTNLCKWNKHSAWTPLILERGLFDIKNRAIKDDSSFKSWQLNFPGKIKESRSMLRLKVPSVPVFCIMIPLQINCLFCATWNSRVDQNSSTFTKEKSSNCFKVLALFSVLDCTLGFKCKFYLDQFSSWSI